MLRQALPVVQDEARDVTVAAMVQAAFESDLHCEDDGTSSSAAVTTLAAAQSCTSNSDCIVVMSMVATDALVQVQVLLCVG